MRTINVNIYEFSELSPKAKQRVKDEHAENEGYVRSDEALDSLKALAKHFGGKLLDYSVDWENNSSSYASFDYPAVLDANEIKRLLGQLGSFNFITLKGLGDCKLTGFCMDESAIDGMRIEWVRQQQKEEEIDLESMLSAAFDSWLKACQEDYKCYYSDEQFAEFCEANEYEFYEDGEIV